MTGVQTCALPILGTLGQQQQQAATTGLGTLSTMGGAEQALAQKELDYPMVQAQNLSQLLRQFNIPMGSTQQVTGSTGYSTSPLAQITGLMSALSAFQGTGNKSVVGFSTNSAGKGVVTYSDGTTQVIG